MHSDSFWFIVKKKVHIFLHAQGAIFFHLKIAIKFLPINNLLQVECHVNKNIF